jgi:hypothetical protein
MRIEPTDPVLRAIAHPLGLTNHRSMVFIDPKCQQCYRVSVSFPSEYSSLNQQFWLHR